MGTSQNKTVCTSHPLSSMGYVLFLTGSSYGGTKLLGWGGGGIKFHFNLKLTKIMLKRAIKAVSLPILSVIVDLVLGPFYMKVGDPR